MLQEPDFSLPSFRGLFPEIGDAQYRMIEDRLRSYLQVTIRLVNEDIAAGRLDLTNEMRQPTISEGPVAPETTHLS